jgi:hypothetical protein
MAATGTVTVSGVRAALAGLLEPVAPGDPDVIDHVADAVAPPVLMIRWADPWLEADGQCRYTARLEVWAVTPRLEPAAAVADLEQLVSLVLRRVSSDPYAWRVLQVDAPGAVAIGGVDYLGCRVQLRAPADPNPED